MDPRTRDQRRHGGSYRTSPTHIVLVGVRAQVRETKPMSAVELLEDRALQAEARDNMRLSKQLAVRGHAARHHALVAKLIALIEHHEHVGALVGLPLDGAEFSVAAATSPLRTSGVALRGPSTLPLAIHPAGFALTA